MRGKIDLSWHKLAGLYKPPARSSRHRRKRMPKMPGGTKGIYFMLWRIVDGAVRDCFERHPEYLTDAGRMAAQLSITKRVTGALMGYASQVPITESDAECRSVGRGAVTGQVVDAPQCLAQADTDAAADMVWPTYGWLDQTEPACSSFVGDVLTRICLWRQALNLPPKIQEGADV